MEIITVNGKPVFRSNTQSFYDNQFSQKVLANIDTKTLFKKIDAIPGLAGAGIVYIDSKYNIIELRKFEPVCQLNPIKIVLREPPQLMSQAEFASHLKGSQGNIRESNLVGELGNAAWSCGTAALGWMVVIGSMAAIPLTGGTSSAITYLAGAGATAGLVQCINGAMRSYNAYENPEKNDNLDSQEWYQNATSAVDLVSLAGAGAAALGTIKAIKMMQLGTSKNTYEILKGLSRAEKKRLNREITRLNLPGASGKLIKSMARKGNIKKYTGKQITHAFRLHLMDAVGASMSISGSLFNGTIGTMAIGIYEELAD
ncbi:MULTISPECIES: hypothetical protein [Shewanella]|uniref:NAD synthetase n=1 Tax=Shewanella psychromarinicola TaxID=2487742 RepID=A0A3N4E2M4_9GAMM|nr:hypothetical protein [Shewanella psychromarinicola]AZG34267.1 hypothetical protein EGC80_04555 [Shewanella psychromarinicola]MCL1083545.1 hypothetical protein [Shewanella psychromarinicola]RPA32363.1 hypothetical protein EGC77_11160 [Shewanella psychromarinicola]